MRLTTDFVMGFAMALSLIGAIIVIGAVMAGVTQGFGP